MGSAVLAAFATWAYTVGPSTLGIDAHAYWIGGRMPHPYGLAPGSMDAVLYSPVFITLMRGAALAPWAVFLGALMIVNALAFWWLSAPLPWRWRVPALTACWPALLLCNINPILCVFTVLALTRSKTWAVAPLALTKVTPALVPIIWWLAHRQWWRAAQALLLTLTLIAVTYTMDSDLWSEWLRFLGLHADDSPFRLARLTTAALLAVWAARTNRLWLAGLAFYLLLPMAGWHVQALAGLMVLPRLVSWGRAAAPGTSSVSLEVGKAPTCRLTPAATPPGS